MDDEPKAYRIVCKVVRQEGHCAMGHKVGDEVVMDESGVHGHICFHALYSLIPKAFAMMYGAVFPWLEDKDVATHACPDAQNPLVFELRRVR